MADILTFTANPAIDVSTAVDRVQPTHKLRCSTLQRDPGGGGINVARVVHRLGGDVAAFYVTGGTTGQLLRRLVEREGVSSHTFDIAEETREDFTVTEEQTGQQYRFVLPGPHLGEDEWRGVLAALAACAPQPRYFVISGSLPPSVPSDYYAQAVRIAKGWGARAVVDSSGAALAAALDERVYLIKPNLRELCELVGASLSEPPSWIDASRQLVIDGRAEMVALTLGHRGALLVTREGAWRAPALPITPVSAVGAGDSFLGALVLWLARGAGPADALRAGAAAGSAAVLHHGTELARAEEFARLYDRVITAPA